MGLQASDGKAPKRRSTTNVSALGALVPNADVDELMSKVCANLLALALGFRHNWQISAPRKRSAIAFDR